MKPIFISVLLGIALAAGINLAAADKPAGADAQATAQPSEPSYKTDAARYIQRHAGCVV